MLSPAETGVHGNSHMIMQDKNNLQIADLILKWIDERVSKARHRKEIERSLSGSILRMSYCPYPAAMRVASPDSP